MKESLCRPDNEHWCTECCLRSGTRCFLFGKTEDGKTGCLGHNGKKYEGLTELPACMDFDCLDDFLPDDREIIRQTISRLPAGEFKMSKVLKELKMLK